MRKDGWEWKESKYNLMFSFGMSFDFLYAHLRCQRKEVRERVWSSMEPMLLDYEYFSRLSFPTKARTSLLWVGPQSARSPYVTTYDHRSVKIQNISQLFQFQFE